MQAIAALVLAGVFGHYYGRYGRSYLRLWTLSWLALAVYSVASGVTLAIAVLTPLSPLRTGFSLLSLIASYFQATWLLAGAFEIATNRPHRRDLLRLTLAAAVVVAVASVLVGRSTPGASELRLFLRVGVRYLVTGLAFLGAGVFLWKSRLRGAQAGVRLVTGVFLGYGLHLSHLSLLYLAPGFLPQAYREALSQMGILDLLAIVLTGVGLVMWLLEEEQERVEEAQHRVRELETHDLLTGLANRDSFLRGLDRRLEVARPHRVITMVGAIDIDRFQDLNDTLGHGGGDEVLRRIADRLTRSVRGSDLVARLGADEFAFSLGGFSRRSDAIQAVSRLLEPLRFPLRIGDREVQCRTSTGLAVAPDDGEEAEELLRCAHVAQRRVQEAGGSDLLVYSSALPTRTVEQLDFEEELRVAQESDQLFLRYQPVVDQPSGYVIGVEALLRWGHPTRGELGPAEFLELAANLGLMGGIDRWVLSEACGQAQRWRESGYGPRVAVNLSASTFLGSSLSEWIQLLLGEHPLAIDSLQLEITEHDAMRDLDAGMAVLEELRSLGIPVCIDDFGVGHSSFSYLHRLPVDTIKIDKSFVQRASLDRREATIVSAIISMAHSLGLSVVAEGVETEAQARLLVEQGCRSQQGFLYFRPLRADEVAKLLSEQGSQPTSSQGA